MTRPDVEQVLDGIYDAAADPQLWPRALERLGDRFGAAAIIAGVQKGIFGDTVPLFATSIRLDEALLRVFVDHYVDPRTNPTLQHYSTVAPGEPFNVLQLSGKEEFLGTSFYSDLYIPQKLWPSAHASMFRDGDLIAPIGMTARQGSDELGFGEIEEFKFWLGHLARAMRVTARLVRQNHEMLGLQAVFDRLQVGIMLLGPGANIVHLNSAAEEIVRASDGLGIRSRKLVASRSNDNKQLARLCGAACSLQQRGGGRMAVARPSGSPAYGVDVVSLASHPERPVAAVFISDPLWETRTKEQDLVCLLGLTPAEARMALKIVEGRTLPRAAGELHISLNTAKTLLQRAYAKTQTSRQAELVRLICAMIPRLRN
jgi:DNA-binding CsgD family transcriptional regulator/PAS domain-containing protein